MAALWIAGAGTDVGKTHVAAALTRALVAAGRPVEVLKPVVSGFDESAPSDSDPARLLDALGRAWTREDLERIAPWHFAAPLSPPLAARLEGRPIDGRAVIAHCRARAQQAGGSLLIIEGAGGVMSPLDERLTMLDLMAALTAPVVLVGGAYLGAISHTLTAWTALRARGLEVRAVVICDAAGEPPPLDDTRAAIAAHIQGAPAIVMPRGVEGPAVAELLAALQGKAAA